MPPGDEKLYDRVLEATVRSARATLDLHSRLDSVQFEPLGERIDSFRANAAPLDFTDEITGGFHVRDVDAKAFLTALEMHPSYTGAAALDVGLPVIGPDGIGNDKQREDAAELLLLGGLALSRGANEKHLDALVQI